MHATYDTTRIAGRADIRSRTAQASTGRSGSRSAVDLTGTCSCGQELDSRHARCTRCGR